MRCRICDSPHLLVVRMKANLGSLAIVVIAMPYIFWLGRNLPWTPAHVAGLVLLPTGFILLAIARIQLGGSFSVQPKATQLVTTGLYSRFRNPVYTFGSVTAAGLILWLNRPLYLLVFLVLIPLQVWRAGKESKVLRERFGAAYDEYCKGTWF
jgi:protein-S-isoprenylcysteine O-methyltransferase Ste14